MSDLFDRLGAKTDPNSDMILRPHKEPRWGVPAAAPSVSPDQSGRPLEWRSPSWDQQPDRREISTMPTGRSIQSVAPTASPAPPDPMPISMPLPNFQVTEKTLEDGLPIQPETPDPPAVPTLLQPVMRETRFKSAPDEDAPKAPDFIAPQGPKHQARAPQTRPQEVAVVPAPIAPLAPLPPQPTILEVQDRAPVSQPAQSPARPMIKIGQINIVAPPPPAPKAPEPAPAQPQAMPAHAAAPKGDALKAYLGWRR